MKRQFTWKAAVALVASSALALSACGGSDSGGSAKGDIVVGMSTALSGPASIFGTTTKNSVNLAIKEQNAKGGLLGRKIKLVTYDDQFSPQKTQTNIRRLIKDDKVDMIVAPAGSGPALAGVGLAKASKKLFFVTVAQTDEITYPDGVDKKPAENVFSTAIPNSVEAKFLAGAVPKISTKIGLIAETTPYGQSGLDQIEDNLKGADVVGRQAYDQGASSMTAQLLKLDKAGAEVILPIGLGPDLVTLRKNMATLDMDQVLAGGGGLGLVGYYGVVGKLANGSKFATPSVFATPGKYSTEARKFADAYKAAYGNDEAYGKGDDPQPSFGVFATRGYQAAQVYFAAIEKAGSTDTAKVRAALESGADIPTVTGPVTFSTSDHYAFTTDDEILSTIVVGSDGKVNFDTTQ